MVRAIAEAMFSEDGEVDPARLEAHVGEVDAFVSAASKTTRLGMRVALFLVRLAPVLLFFRLTTLDRLPIAERVALLSRLERSTASHLSLAFVGWRTVMTLVFYEDAAELRRLGYDEERRRYRRTLPVAAAVSAATGSTVRIPELLDPAAVLPAPLESGVRLKDSELPAATAPARAEPSRGDRDGAWSEAATDEKSLGQADAARLGRTQEVA